MHIVVPDGGNEPGLDGWLPATLQPEEVLYAAEEPIVFLTRANDGAWLLAYLAEETTEGALTFLAPASDRIRLELLRGALPVRDALTGSWMWAHAYFRDDRPTRVWGVTPAEIPGNLLPRPGTPLLPEHRHVLRARAVGQALGLGQTPASVAAFVADGPRKAVKGILDFVTGALGGGRPSDGYRALYDLPILRVAFSSFEIAFGAPAEGLLPDPDIPRVVDRLRAGLAWAAGPDGAPPPGDSPEERAAILGAVLNLTPPAGSPITEVQLGGAWAPGRGVRLNSDSRRRVSAALKRETTEAAVVLSGRIGEIDVDRLTFVLRDIVGQAGERRGSFTEEMLDTMKENVDARVLLIAMERGDFLTVGAVAPDRRGEVRDEGDA